MLTPAAMPVFLIRRRTDGGVMRRILVVFGGLALFAGSTICLAQDTGQGGTPGEGVPEAAAPPVPVMPGEVEFESSVGNVLFPHNVHLKFGCASCHHQIHAGALETPHPDYMESTWVKCRTCHSAEPALPGPYYRCSACHQSEPNDISDETLSSKVVVHQSCWKCHKSGTGVEASRGCGDCHVKEEREAEVPSG